MKGAGCFRKQKKKQKHDNIKVRMCYILYEKYVPEVVCNLGLKIRKSGKNRAV